MILVLSFAAKKKKELKAAGLDGAELTTGTAGTAAGEPGTGEAATTAIEPGT